VVLGILSTITSRACSSDARRVGNLPRERRVEVDVMRLLLAESVALGVIGSALGVLWRRSFPTSHPPPAS